MAKAIFYHAGCPVCISAERDILNLIPENQVEVIRLGTDKIKVKNCGSGLSIYPQTVPPS